MKPAGQNSGMSAGATGFGKVARQRFKNCSDSKSGCRDCVQRRFCLAQGLDGIEAQSLENLVSRCTRLERNETLYCAGKEQRNLYAVRSGTIKLSCNPGTGSEQVIGFRFPGEIFGLETLGGAASTHSAVAVEASSVCQISVAEFVKTSRESRALQHHLYQLFAQQISSFNLARMTMGKGKAETALATFLLDIADRYASRGYSGSDFHLSMSRAEIGNYVGIALETVSRLFSRLQAEGVLQVDKRHVVIRDRERLEFLAGGGLQPCESVG